VTPLRKPRIGGSLAAALGLAALVGMYCDAAGATTQTITTTYTYNADGAPTAVTTQVDTAPATSTYLTWDNFTPDSAAPATGTIGAADGNLIGIGASPGLTGLSTQLSYDVRDRLTTCSSGQSSA